MITKAHGITNNAGDRKKKNDKSCLRQTISLTNYFLLFGAETIIYQGTFFDAAAAMMLKMDSSIDQPSTLMSIEKCNPAKEGLTEYVCTNRRHKHSGVRCPGNWLGFLGHYI